MAVAKTRVRDRIVRRQEILLAAGRVFLKKGFRLATMEDIASAAEVGVGTLYHYFRSKEHLFASLLLESTQMLHDRLRAAAAKPLPPQLGLLAINRAYVDYYSEFPEYFRIQMFFQYDFETGAEFAKERKKIQRLARANFELLAEKLRAGQAIGAYRPDVDPMTGAFALWASYNGIFLAATNSMLLELAELSVEQLLATAAFIHFAGIGSAQAIAPELPHGHAATPSKVDLADLQQAVRSAPWISPSMIFAGMGMTFQSEKALGVREVYEYRLSGKRGGTWTVKIDDGTIAVADGAAENPGVILEMSDERFLQLVTGQAEAVDLLVSGELKVTGSLQSAARFQGFFLPVAPKAA